MRGRRITDIPWLEQGARMRAMHASRRDPPVVYRGST